MLGKFGGHSSSVCEKMQSSSLFWWESALNVHRKKTRFIWLNFSCTSSGRALQQPITCVELGLGFFPGFNSLSWNTKPPSTSVMADTTFFSSLELRLVWGPHNTKLAWGEPREKELATSLTPWYHPAHNMLKRSVYSFLLWHSCYDNNVYLFHYFFLWVCMKQHSVVFKMWGTPSVWTWTQRMKPKQMWVIFPSDKITRDSFD